MNERIKYLIDRYLAGQCTAEEMQELEVWYDELGSGKPEKLIKGSVEADERLQALFNRLKAATSERPPLQRSRTFRITFLRSAAAILVLGMLATMIYMFTRNDGTTSIAGVVVDALPGGSHATLTLGNGQVVYLDSAGNGQVADQHGIRILKLDSGSLVYKGEATSVTYNTLSTPKGGEYHITLPDGSDVWLNAASSITFPTVFNNATREVTITGEAYFEITSLSLGRPARTDGSGGGARGEAKMPFIVKKGDMQVTVLGTHFNVNAYDDESDIKVTLLEGSVKVSRAAESVMITPGQQVAIHHPIAIGSSSDTYRMIIHNSTDLDQVMSWKNGFFNFSNNSLPAIMRQLERWYNIKVKYEGAIPEFSFRGKLDRNVNLSEVLDILNKMGVTCKFNGADRTLTVKAKN